MFCKHYAVFKPAFYCVVANFIPTAKRGFCASFKIIMLQLTRSAGLREETPFRFPLRADSSINLGRNLRQSRLTQNEKVSSRLHDTVTVFKHCPFPEQLLQSNPRQPPFVSSRCIREKTLPRYNAGLITSQGAWRA